MVSNGGYFLKQCNVYAHQCIDVTYLTVGIFPIKGNQTRENILFGFYFF
jgi:hypothetical protein